MNAIKLNFINQSQDVNNSEVVIFQKNEAAGFGEIPVAWKIIQHAGKGWTHPFTFPAAVTIAVADSWGNISPQMPAANGQAFSVVNDPSGDAIEPSGAATSPNQIEILNRLPTGSINAHIYRDGALLATKPGIAPGQKAEFQFQPTIWIGVVSQLQEGELINAAIMSQINSQISLIGIAGADIVMTGGGPGKGATPFIFVLQNVKYA